MRTTTKCLNPHTHCICCIYICIFTALYCCLFRSEKSHGLHCLHINEHSLFNLFSCMRHSAMKPTSCNPHRESSQEVRPWHAAHLPSDPGSMRFLNDWCHKCVSQNNIGHDSESWIITTLASTWQIYRLDWQDWFNWYISFRNISQMYVVHSCRVTWPAPPAHCV